jgi:hypothetical protein
MTVLDLGIGEEGKVRLVARRKLGHASRHALFCFPSEDSGGPVPHQSRKHVSRLLVRELVRFPVLPNVGKAGGQQRIAVGGRFSPNSPLLLLDQKRVGQNDGRNSQTVT